MKKNWTLKEINTTLNISHLTNLGGDLLMINNTTNNFIIPEKNKQKKNIILAVLTNKVLFIIHAFLYLAVNGLIALLWAINLSLEPIPFIPIFPILGWGIGIGIHAITYIMYNEKSQLL